MPPESSPYVTPLPCGCIPGSVLCAEAERLWQDSGVAYRAAKAGQGPWSAYDRLRAEYQAHVGAEL